MCVCVFVSISNHSVPTAVHKEDRRLKIIPCHPFVLFSRCFSFAWTKIEFFFHSLTLSLMLPSLTPPFRYFYFLHERKWHKDCINCQFCSILRGSKCSSNSEDDIFFNNFISSTLQPSLLIKCYIFKWPHLSCPISSCYQSQFIITYSFFSVSHLNDTSSLFLDAGWLILDSFVAH